jgi:hypothetical protein
MPVKLRPSQTVRARGATKSTTTHHYMKMQTVEVLEKELESCRETDLEGRVTTKKGKGKIKQKILNELVRREIKPYKTHFKVVE